MDKNEALGIPNYGPWYFSIKDGQHIAVEIVKTHKFMQDVIEGSNNVPEFQGEKDIKFINYGDTQLVYVLTVNGNKQYTLLVNQPHTEFGTGKREFDNLSLLNKNNHNVIRPFFYAENGERELYATPYSYQARCVGIEKTEWGMWVPEPEYVFKEFTDSERQIINSSMVAMLVQLYDARRKLGLAECRLDGGDFMLEKGFEEQELSCDSILQKMKLIAARKLIYIGFDEYIEKLKAELSGKEKGPNIILGKKLVNPMTEEEIEKGILLGKENRDKEKHERD